MTNVKVAVVTGANKGIGLAIVRNLCKQFEGNVYLTSRNENLGHEAVDNLNRDGFYPKYHHLDINSMDSITRFRDFMKQTHGGIDVLVNNAGILHHQQPPESFPREAEEVIRINYFGTYNICQELFPLLRRNARVVNITSSAGHLSQINGQEPQATNLRKMFANPNLTIGALMDLVNCYVNNAKVGMQKENGWPNDMYNAYRVSKVALSAMSRILQREMDKSRPEDNIIINHVHPGLVDTDMTKTIALDIIKKPLTPKQGAVAATWLALLSSSEENIRGAYIWHDKTIVDWVNGPMPAPY